MTQRILTIDLGKSEKWVGIRGYEDYEANEYGVIRKAVASNQKKAGDILSQFLRKNGYYQVILCKNGKRKRFLVHRLVALAFIGEQPTDLHEIAHLDGDRGNNHYSNLAWKTHKDNELDKVFHGTVLRGEMIVNAKLTSEQASEIKARLSLGDKHVLIAKDYGVHPSTISLIARNIYWRHA
jgi:hypothetical protein